MSLQNRIAAATRRPTAGVVDESAEGTRRWAKRKPVNSNGQILFDGSTTPHACLVRDISSTGAKIEVQKTKYNSDGSTGFVPTYFTLAIPLDRTLVECQSMWRRGSFMGVRFLGAVRQMEKPAQRVSIRNK